MDGRTVGLANGQTDLRAAAKQTELTEFLSVVALTSSNQTLPFDSFNFEWIVRSLVHAQYDIIYPFTIMSESIIVYAHSPSVD